MDQEPAITRRRVKHVLTFEERLREAARAARAEAARLPPGDERDRLLSAARESEATIQISRWMSRPAGSPRK